MPMRYRIIGGVVGFAAAVALFVFVPRGNSVSRALELVEVQKDATGAWKIYRRQPTPHDSLERYTADGRRCLLWLVEPELPAPGPEPNPPAPMPGPVDGRFAVARFAFEQAKSVGRPQEAAALAAAFHQTAEKTRSDGLAGPAVINVLKAACNAVVLPPSRAAWSGVNGAIGAKLREFYGAAKLGSPGDWADCLDEISRGLQAAGTAG
jgi:hypothetical protein